jgi:hypothetical protein
MGGGGGRAASRWACSWAQKDGYAQRTGARVHETEGLERGGEIGEGEFGEGGSFCITESKYKNINLGFILK